MHRIFKYSTFLLVLLLFSCTENPIEFGSINSFKIGRYENTYIKCNAEVEIKNNRYFDVTIEAGELYAYTDNTNLGTVKLLEPLVIHGNSKQVYAIPFSVDITNPEAGMVSLLGRLSGKKPVYSLRGTVIAKSFLVNKKIVVNEVLGK